MYENHYDSLLPCPKRQKCLSYDQNLTMMDLIAPTNNSLFGGNNIVVPKVPEFYYDEVAMLGNGESTVVAAVVEGERKKNENTLPPRPVARPDAQSSSSARGCRAARAHAALCERELRARRHECTAQLPSASLSSERALLPRELRVRSL